MNVGAITNLNLPIGGGTTPGGDANEFSRALNREVTHGRRHDAPRSDASDAQRRTTSAEEARMAASQLVSMVFVQPLLAQMRESPFATERFGPTMVENRFGPMFDALIADRITRASDLPITDAVVDRLLQSPQTGGDA